MDSRYLKTIPESDSISNYQSYSSFNSDNSVDVLQTDASSSMDELDIENEYSDASRMYVLSLSIL